MRSTRAAVRGCLVWLMVVVVLVGCARRGGGGRPAGGSSRPGVEVPVPGVELLGGTTGGTAGDSAGGGIGSRGDGDAGGGTTGYEGTSGGGSEERETEPERTDATQEAFRDVDRGSCLPVYRDGNGWNVEVPPSAVSCRSRRAGLFQVTRTATSSVSCPTGVGRDTWSYYSPVTGDATTLCLNRVWVANYCVLATQSGGAISSIGSSTAVDCQATRVPKPYNQLLVVSGVYRAPSDADASYCRTGAHDSRRYWSLLADGGDTLVCFSPAS